MTSRVIRCWSPRARGDQHLTIGVPQLLQRYEQATDLVHLDCLVVDREGMAAEFLFQLHSQGRRVVTLLRSNQYKDEGSFTEVGEWLPWRLDRQGSVVCARGGSPVSTATPYAARPAVDGTGRSDSRLAEVDRL
jgi:hypothetical protein